LANLKASALESWLVERGAEGMAAATRNGYRRACVGFGNWCVRTKRLLSNPFALVPKADEKADPRHRRRAMTEAELARLLRVARWRPLAEYGREKEPVERPDVERKRSNWCYRPLTYDGIDAAVSRARQRLAKRSDFIAQLEARGRERALVYKTLVLTGLRRNELATLSIGQVELDADVPHAVLDAANEKNREGNSVPLRSDLVADLRRWLADRLADLQATARAASKPMPVRLPPDTPLFYVPDKLSKILNRDLRVAGIPKRDDRNRVLDVHALRVSYSTLLSKAGVPLRTAQAAMRHSDPSLTANIYVAPKLLDVGSAVEALPSLPLDDDGSERQRATGTFDANVSLAPMLAPTAENLVQALVQADESGQGAKAGSGSGGAAVTSATDKPKQSSSTAEAKADGGIRTHNPGFTKAVLYR